MGNEQTIPQPGESSPPDFINAMRRGTPFTYSEVDQILRRYSTMDSSAQGKTGISIQDCSLMPEFTASIFSDEVIRYFKDKDSKRIHPRNFMKICTLYCRRTSALKKKQFLFDMLDTDKQKLLGHDAMFRMYKMMLGNVVSDDHILALTFSALRHPNLARDDEVSREEFCDMISDNEIQEKLSIDFAFDPTKETAQQAADDDDDEEEEDDDDEG